jgi:hypothetical protein
MTRYGSHAEAVDAGADDREDRREEGERRGYREPDDDRPGHAHGSQDHELEQDEPEQAQEHRQPGEEHRPAGRRHGDPDGFLHAVGSVAFRELLAEPARQEQRVVHPEAEPEERREIEHEDAHRDEGRDHEDPGEGHEDRRPADRERDARGDEAAEHEEEGERSEGEGDELRPAQVALGHRLDVAVERGAAADPDGEPGHLVEGGGDRRDRVRRVVGRQVEEHDVVRRVPVGAHLRRCEDVAEDAGDVR